MYRYSALNDLERIRTGSRLTRFTAVHNGIVVIPDCKTSRAHPLPYTFILKNVRYYDVLKDLPPGMEHVIGAVRRFMDLNSVRYDKLDDEVFHDNLIILTHFMHRYLRAVLKIEVGSVDGVPLRYDGPDRTPLAEFMTPAYVERMYNDLYEHLLRVKNLNRWTAKDILYGKHGMANTLQILNDLQEMVRQKNPRSADGSVWGVANKEYQGADTLLRELRTTIERLRLKSIDQFVKDMGTTMENKIPENKRQILREVQTRLGGAPREAVIVPLDSDLAVHEVIERRCKCPDFMYIDSDGRIMGIDCTMTTTTAANKVAQISAATLKRALVELGYPPQFLP